MRRSFGTRPSSALVGTSASAEPARGSATASSPKSQSRCRSGFTLVEMMIVQGIIVVLLAVLLPTISRARRQSESAACLSNLRQLAAAFTMYSADNKGWMPRPAQNVVLRPDDWIFYQTNKGRDPNDGAIVKYLGGKFDPKVFRCPGDDTDSHPVFSDPHWPFPVKYEYSYSVNENICHIYGWTPLKLCQVRNPAEKILLVDEASTTIDDGCWAWQPRFGIDGNVVSIRHDQRAEHENDFAHGRGNVAFCDGHAAAIERKETFSPRHYDPKF